LNIIIVQQAMEGIDLRFIERYITMFPGTLKWPITDRVRFHKVSGAG
jgi:hypothetical protein